MKQNVKHQDVYQNRSKNNKGDWYISSDQEQQTRYCHQDSDERHVVVSIKKHRESSPHRPPACQAHAENEKDG